MAKIPSMETLLEAGVHYGHQARRWNPKMGSFIFTQKSGIHLIDLEKTEKKLEEAVNFIKEVASKGGSIIFLTTKKQLAPIIEEEAQRVGAMYLTQRWLGGLLTNFESVRKTIEKLNDLEEQLKSAEGRYTKKEQQLMQREINKLNRLLGGIRIMERLPDALFIIDARKEDNAVREANKMGIRVVALVDTNGDPTKVEFPIPANDDSVKSVALLVKAVADGFEEGKQIHSKKQIEDEKRLAKEAEKAKS